MLSFPLMLGLLFRVSTSHLFLALLSSELLERYFADDAKLVLEATVAQDWILEYVGLVILVLPMVLTAIFLRRTLSRGKTILHIIPLAISGVVFAAFAVVLLPGALLAQLEANHYGRMLLGATDLIIGVMIFLHLISMWLLGRSSEKHSQKHRS
jgi:hypothetical protein